MHCYIQNISSISPQSTFESEGFLAEITAGDINAEWFSAIEPDYKKYIADAGLRRRMSRIIKMGVAAALDCVQNSETANPDAIITATGLGCLADTEKFLNAVVVNDERLLNPTAFIQSTFNTIGAQVALILKNHNYNYTYVHRGFSFESAVSDAMMRLEDGDAQHVLTGGIDEATPTSVEIMRRMGFWANGAKAGEGAQFFMLSANPSSRDYAKLKAVSSFLLQDETVEEKIKTFLAENESSPDDIDLILLGNSGDKKQDEPINSIKETLFADVPSARFKQLCGEYQTASSFGLWCAARILREQKLPPAMNPDKTVNEIRKILLYNVYRNTNHSLFLLEKT